MTKLKEFKWQAGALALLLFAIMMAKGGEMALRPLLRFLLPAGLIYWVYREAKRRFLAVAGDKIRQQIQEAMRRNGGFPGAAGGFPGGPGTFGGQSSQRNKPADGGQVIDLCPKCGAYLGPKHKCAT